MARPVIFIDKCPECGTPLERKEGEAAHYCPNEVGCPPQIMGKMEHFVSRKAMDIDGLGKGTIKLLFHKNLLNRISDIYDLKNHSRKIIGLETLVVPEDEIITEQNKIPVERILYCFKSASLTLANSKKLIESVKPFDVFKITVEDLLKIIDVKQNIAIKIIDFLKKHVYLKRIFVNLTESDKSVFPSTILKELAGLSKEKAEIVENHFGYYYFIQKADISDFEEIGLNMLEIQSLLDFFHRKDIDHNRLNHLGKISIQKKTFENIIEGIEASKQEPFEKVLFSLGIRFVGETVAKKLAKRFKSIDNLMNASYEELIEIDDIGDRIAKSVLSFFENKKNLQLIEKLKNEGLNFETKEELPSNNLLENLNFVVTGNFGSKEIRENLKKTIEKHGGKVSSSISKNTNFLVAGEKAGPEKLKKAQELNIEIFNKTEFEKKFNIT